MKALFVLLLLATAASLTTASVSQAAHATRCVGGPGCYPTLAAALAAATDGDTVRVNPGTYAGGIAIVHSITLQGAGAGKTIIAGGGPVLTLGSYKAAAEPTISIDGVTITDGVTTTSAESRDWAGEDGVFAFGGGIDIPPDASLAGGATVLISNSVVTQNEAAPTVTLGCTQPCNPFAEAAGGGIYNAGHLTLRNTIVDHNTSGGPIVSKAIGGGILGTPNGSSLTVENSTVSDNRVTVADPNGVQATGAGILSETGAFVVRNSVITGNRSELTSTKASVDGPFFANVAGIGCDRSATIINTRIENNVVTASDPNGQPAAFDSGMGCGNSGGPLTLQNSSISYNHVEAHVADTTDSGPDGTAVEFDDTATVSNTIITGNSVTVTTAGGIAGAQGAVLNFAPNPSNPTTISNSLIKNNTMTADSGGGGAASVQGGGIANTGALALQNTVISGNSGTANGSGGFGQGAGVWNGSLFGSDATLLTIDRTIVTANSLSGGVGAPLQGAGIYSFGFAATLTRSTVEGNSPDQCFGLTC
jgi:hypothetical protein